MSLLEGIVDAKLLKILMLFLKNPNELYHINKVSRMTGVPVATAFRMMKTLHKEGFIEATQISKFKIYRMAENSRTRKMRRLL